MDLNKQSRDATEEKVRGIKEIAPAGTKVISFPRRYDFIGSLLQTVTSFLLWHYWIWALWSAGFLLIIWYLDLASATSIFIFLVLYYAQLIFYRPQFKQGTPYWFYKWFLLNHTFMDRAHAYFNSIMVREGPDVDPTKKYMFGYTPHGILGLCRGASGGSAWHKLYPEVYPRWGSFGAAFYLPGIREFSHIFGVVDAGKKTLMQLDSSIALIPGGIREMSLTDRDSKVTQLVLKDRFGFISLAKERGMPLVPVFVFGEKWATKKVTVRPEGLRRWLMSHQLSGVGFIGRFMTLLPFNDKPMGSVFGEPIDTADDTVEELHAKFLKSIENIFEKYKKFFEYDDDEKIEFVSTKITEQKEKD